MKPLLMWCIESARARPVSEIDINFNCYFREKSCFQLTYNISLLIHRRARSPALPPLDQSRTRRTTVDGLMEDDATTLHDGARALGGDLGAGVGRLRVRAGRPRTPLGDGAIADWNIIVMIRESI